MHRMPRFRARQYSNKLIVTVNEYQTMMIRAEEHAAPRSVFNVPFCTPIQKNKKGMLIAGNGAQESQFTQPAAAESFYAVGGLSREVGIPKTPPGCAQAEASAVTPESVNMDIGERMCAKVREMTVALRHNPSAMEAMFAHISSMHETIISRTAANLSSDNLANLISFPESDKRRRGTRGKSAGEPDRKKMKQAETVELTMFQSQLNF